MAPQVLTWITANWDGEYSWSSKGEEARHSMLLDDKISSLPNVFLTIAISLIYSRRKFFNI